MLKSVNTDKAEVMQKLIEAYEGLEKNQKFLGYNEYRETNINFYKCQIKALEKRLIKILTDK